jgi:hypothetical protein
MNIVVFLSFNPSAAADVTIDPRFTSLRVGISVLALRTPQGRMGYDQYNTAAGRECMI